MTINIPNHLNSMVKTNVVVIATAREDPAAIELPRRSIPRHSQGPHSGQVLHGGRHVIGRECVVAGDPNHWGSSLQVILAVASHTCIKVSIHIQSTKTLIIGMKTNSKQTKRKTVFYCFLRSLIGNISRRALSALRPSCGGKDHTNGAYL